MGYGVLGRVENWNLDRCRARNILFFQVNASESRPLPREFPLTPFEEYLYWEDRRSYPYWMVLKCIFKGKLDRERLEAAFAEAITNHPLATATLERRKGRLCWRLNPEAVPDIHFETVERRGGDPDYPRFDLAYEGALRFFVRSDASGFDFFFQIHHSAFDGLGGFQILREVFLRYGQAGDPTIEIPRVDVEALAFREDLGKTDAETRLSIWKGLLVSMVMRIRQGSPLLPHAIPADDEPPPPNWPNVVSHRFDPEAFSDLRKVAKTEKVSLNEILVRDFQVALGAWRRAEGFGRDADWIRVTVPINLRGWDDRYLSACNGVSVVTLDRQMKSLRRERRPRLLFRANEDMEAIRKQGLDRLFWKMLGIYRKLPGGIRARFGRKRGISTAVFTHLGRLFGSGPLLNAERKVVLGEAVMEDMRLTAPIRPLSLVSVDSYIYANRLSTDLHYDGRFFEEAQMRSLMEMFVAEVESSRRGE